MSCTIGRAGIMIWCTMLFSQCKQQATVSAWFVHEMFLCFKIVLTVRFEGLGIIAVVISHLRKKLSTLQLGISIEL